jgi:hypothetical protein
MQECVTLSVAEVALMTLIACVQQMIHADQIDEFNHEVANDNQS